MLCVVFSRCVSFRFVLAGVVPCHSHSSFVSFVLLVLFVSFVSVFFRSLACWLAGYAPFFACLSVCQHVCPSVRLSVGLSGVSLAVCLLGDLPRVPVIVLKLGRFSVRV